MDMQGFKEHQAQLKQASSILEHVRECVRIHASSSLYTGAVYAAKPDGMRAALALQSWRGFAEVRLSQSGASMHCHSHDLSATELPP